MKCSVASNFQGGRLDTKQKHTEKMALYDKHTRQIHRYRHLAHHLPPTSPAFSCCTRKIEVDRVTSNSDIANFRTTFQKHEEALFRWGYKENINIET